jgi:hypothetical protein
LQLQIFSQKYATISCYQMIFIIMDLFPHIASNGCLFGKNLEEK